MENKAKAKLNFDLEKYEPLPVVYQLRYSILNKVRKGEDPLPDIQGRADVKKDVLRALLSGTHPYLVSEEGTGKTRLARSLTRLLLPIVILKGCPYHDDPKWPRHLLCPRCSAVEDPVKEFGLEVMPGEMRFSRIQGNEYTNEAKLLGLKDIQAIAQGKSPSDPSVFTGTGVFRANRGILFVDELPAIRTKVQVLLHPVLEEKKAILEEYGWEYPLDLVLVATGNPEGFSHVNEVPRPLLDRLELIYMELPEQETEREIMLREKFRVKENYYQMPSNHDIFSYPSTEEIERKVVAPWWTIDLVNQSVRHSRKCTWIDKKASLRGSTKGLDHTYASAELANRSVANLSDVCDGLKLAMRGRTGLRADLIDYDNPRESFRKSDQVTEDLLWNGLEDFDFRIDTNIKAFMDEMGALLKGGTANLTERLGNYPEVNRIIGQMKKAAKDKSRVELSAVEKALSKNSPLDEKTLEEYNYSALEMLVNLALHQKVIDRFTAGDAVFIPRQVSWVKGVA